MKNFEGTKKSDQHEGAQRETRLEEGLGGKERAARRNSLGQGLFREGKFSSPGKERRPKKEDGYFLTR